MMSATASSEAVSVSMRNVRGMSSVVGRSSVTQARSYRIPTSQVIQSRLTYPLRKLITLSYRILFLTYSCVALGQTATQTSLTTSAPTPIFGQSVILTAKVSPSAATGIVTFYNGAVIL